MLNCLKKNLVSFSPFTFAVFMLNKNILFLQTTKKDNSFRFSNLEKKALLIKQESPNLIIQIH